MLRIWNLIRSATHKQSNVKPLSLETVYGGYKYHEPPPLQLEPIKPPIPLLIKKQKSELRKNPLLKFSQIETHTLTLDTYLIGLTKHPVTIWGGVYMYPKELRYFAKWEELKKECIDQQATIAFFKPKELAECIKITRLDCRGDLSVSYLVHHTLMIPAKVLFVPPEPEDEMECEFASI